MGTQDLSNVTDFLAKNLTPEKFDLFPNLVEDDVKRFQQDPIKAFVVENDQNQITAFCSFLGRPTNEPNPQEHEVAIGYLTVTGPVEAAPRLVDLMRDLLVSAKKSKFTAFLCLNSMGDDSFIDELNFTSTPDPTYLHLYNWQCSSIPSARIAMPLL